SIPRSASICGSLNRARPTRRPSVGMPVGVRPTHPARHRREPEPMPDPTSTVVTPSRPLGLRSPRLSRSSSRPAPGTTAAAGGPALRRALGRAGRGLDLTSLAARRPAPSRPGAAAGVATASSAAASGAELPFGDLIDQAAARYNLDPLLLAAVART